MSRPENSRFRDLYFNVSDDFKEDVTIVQREKTGEDDYNRPVFTETEKEVRGRFQVEDVPDQPVEEGGIRDTRKARLFLPLPGGFVDEFQRVALVEDDPLGLWEQVGGGDGEFDGEFEQPVNYAIFQVVETFENYQWDRAKIRFGYQTTNPSSTYWGAGAAQFYFRPKTLDPAFVGFGVDLWDDPILGFSGISAQTSKGGDTDFVFYDLGPGFWQGAPTLYELEIRKYDDRTEFYLDGTLFATLADIVADPRDALVFGIFGPNLRTDYIRSTERDTLRSFSVEDQFIARGQRWSQIEKPLFTHLQSEFTLQEAIPDG